jgi:hypothetical protein
MARLRWRDAPPGRRSSKDALQSLDPLELHGRRTARPAACVVKGAAATSAAAPSRTKGGLIKLQVATNAKGRPIQMFLSAGHRSDYLCAKALLSSLSPAEALIATGVMTQTGPVRLHAERSRPLLVVSAPVRGPARPGTAARSAGRGLGLSRASPQARSVERARHGPAAACEWSHRARPARGSTPRSLRAR